MRIILSLFIFLFFALSLSAQSIRQDVANESYGYDNWGSSFKATKTGEIYRIDVYASGLASTNSNLLIYKGAQGSGDYQVLGIPFYEQILDVDSYRGWTSIFLNTPQTISQDSMYTFIVETTAGVWGIDSINTTDVQTEIRQVFTLFPNPVEDFISVTGPEEISSI